MINQSIKFFTIFLLAFNVFAGGDDRDKEYYEALDQELATFEAQLDAELAAARNDGRNVSRRGACQETG